MSNGFRGPRLGDTWAVNDFWGDTRSRADARKVLLRRMLRIIESKRWWLSTRNRSRRK